MYPYLEAIRKIARYTPQAWGGTTAEVGPGKSKWYDPVIDMGAPALANKGIAAAAGKEFAGKAAAPVAEGIKLMTMASRQGRKVRAASNYGSRLGKSNPYLASSL